MSDDKRVRLMISSRVDGMAKLDKGVRLETLRNALKEEIEAETVLGGPVFEVWLNEDAPSGPADQTWWEGCLQKARDSDIVLVLYNGEAGTLDEGKGMGICHAELEQAYAYGAFRVRIIDVSGGTTGTTPADRNFRTYVEALKTMGPKPRTRDQFMEQCRSTLRDVLFDLAREGATSGTGSNHLGTALEWGLLDFATRKERMERELAKALAGAAGPTVVVASQGRMILAHVNAVPAAMSVAPARELVGQPFRRDARVVRDQPEEMGGPVHFVACHRGVTEAQALRVLGIPDAVAITTPFGVHVVDRIEYVQMTFLANCRDPSAIRGAVARMHEWWTQSGEGARVFDRAVRRRAIVNAVLAANEPLQKPPLQTVRPPVARKSGTHRS